MNRRRDENLARALAGFDEAFEHRPFKATGYILKLAPRPKGGRR